MTKKRNKQKFPYVIIPWGILMGLFLILMFYAYIGNNRPPSKFEYQVFGFIAGIIFVATGTIGIYFRDFGKFVKGRPAIIVGIFIITLAGCRREVCGEEKAPV